MKITAVVLAHHEKRKKQLPIILRALNNGSVRPDNMIVFCNGTEPLPMESEPHIIIINSNHNFGCIARYAVALLTDSDMYFFQDDDLVVERDTLKVFCDYYQHLPGAVLGFFGRLLIRGSETPYTQGHFVSGFLSEADVVYRIQFCSRQQLLQAHELRTKLDHSFFRTDDLLLCLANRGTGAMNYVVPAMTGAAIKNFDEEGVGLSHEEEHYKIRDRVARQLLGLVPSPQCFIEAPAQSPHSWLAGQTSWS